MTALLWAIKNKHRLVQGLLAQERMPQWYDLGATLNPRPVSDESKLSEKERWNRLQERSGGGGRSTSGTTGARVKSSSGTPVGDAVVPIPQMESRILDEDDCVPGGCFTFGQTRKKSGVNPRQIPSARETATMIPTKGTR